MMEEPPPTSILVVMLSAVGDAVLVLPVVGALRRAFPQSNITWVIQPGPHALVQNHSAVDRFILFRRYRQSARRHHPGTPISSLGATVREIRAAAHAEAGGRYDLLLALQVYFKAGLLTALAPARVKLGFDRRRARDLNWLSTTERIPPNPRSFGHVQDQYFEFLRHLGVDPEPVVYGLRPTDEERGNQRAFFREIDRPACAMVVGTSNPRKNWTAEGYARVARVLWHDVGLQPILVGGESPAENAIAAGIRARAGREVLDVRGGGLRRLLWLLEGSDVVISPDTGPLHMARALEVPVVGLFGYTNPKRSGPYRMYQDLLVDGYARYPGEPYELTMEKRPGGMRRINSFDVVERVVRALERYPEDRRRRTEG